MQLRTGNIVGCRFGVNLSMEDNNLLNICILYLCAVNNFFKQGKPQMKLLYIAEIQSHEPGFCLKKNLVNP